MEGDLGQASAGSVEPKVTAGLAENRLVVLVDLLPADPTGIDRGGGGVLLVEDDRLVGRVDGVPAEGGGGRGRRRRPHLQTGRTRMIEMGEMGGVGGNIGGQQP